MLSPQGVSIGSNVTMGATDQHVNEFFSFPTSCRAVTYKGSAPELGQQRQVDVHQLRASVRYSLTSKIPQLTVVPPQPSPTVRNDSTWVVPRGKHSSPERPVPRPNPQATAELPNTGSKRASGAARVFRRITSGRAVPPSNTHHPPHQTAFLPFHAAIEHVVRPAICTISPPVLHTSHHLTDRPE